MSHKLLAKSSRVISLMVVFTLLFSFSAPAVAGITAPMITQARSQNSGTGQGNGDITGSAVFTDSTGTPDVGPDPLMDPIGRGFYSPTDQNSLTFADSVETLVNPALADPPYSPSQGTDPGDNSFFTEGGATQSLAQLETPFALLEHGLQISDQFRDLNSGPHPSMRVAPPGVDEFLGGGSLKTGIGEAFPWEAFVRAGGSSAAPAYINTQPGNLLTVVPIVSWALPGGSSCGLTLYHNSQDDLDLGWGNSWRSNYDFYIINLGPNPASGLNQVAVTYPTGMRVIYTQNGSVGFQNLYLPRRDFTTHSLS